MDADETFLAGAGEMGALVRAIDWAKTPLGPLARWPQSLRTTMSICLNSRFPIAIYWGADYLMLYNESLVPMVGARKHPQSLGQPARIVLAEIWDIIEPLLRQVRTTGEAILSEDLMLPLARRDGPEEGYFTFTYSPARDEAGHVGGVFCAVVETTENVIEGRRLRLFNALSNAARAPTPAAACAQAAAEIAQASRDVPFALLYLVDPASGIATLAGAANVEPGSVHAPSILRPDDPAPWPRPAHGSPPVVAFDGIAPAELPRLFERFHRIEGARSRSHEGSGIGLALVDELVRLHGGDVQVDSREGVGTTFTVRIPRGTGHLAAEHVTAAPTDGGDERPAAVGYAEEALRWMVGATQSVDPVLAADGRRRARVLVADDNADMREYIQRLFAERWDVTTVADGESALASAREDPPDVVVTDAMMPGLDGFGLLAAIRRDPGLRTIPVVMLSARAGEEAVAEGLSAGADDYVVKPFGARELLVRVASRLATARAARETAAIKEDFYRHFIQAPFPVAVFRGPDHVVEVANAATLQAWGRDRAEVIGRPLVVGLPELAGQPFVGHLDAVRRTGIAYEGIEEPARLPSGPGGEIEDHYFSYVYAPLFDAGGVIEGVLMSAVDVTPQVRARRAIEAARDDAMANVVARTRALAEAEQLGRAKDEFLATMSHELRTPLNAILGWSQILQGDLHDAAKVERGVQIIARNARAQARLIEDLLDVSRIISGKLRLAIARVDLTRVLAEALDVVRPAAEAKGVDLVATIDPALGTIAADGDRLQQVVWNLLTNAVRFTPRGGTIVLDATRLPSSVRIEVRDTGAGIPAEHLPHIFERFRQADSSTTRAHGGLGLGLAIVRHLVEAHGGDVHGTSAGANQGATFVVTLPVPTDGPTVGNPRRSDHGAVRDREPAASDPPVDLHGAHVLVIDDDVDSLDLVDVILHDAGATCTRAADAGHAFTALRDGSFDLIVCDIGMPGTDGYTLMRQVRAMGIGTPAIALTAYARAQDVHQTAAAGFDRHLAKPVDHRALRTTARALLER